MQQHLISSLIIFVHAVVHGEEGWMTVLLRKLTPSFFVPAGVTLLTRNFGRLEAFVVLQSNKMANPRRSSLHFSAHLWQW